MITDALALFVVPALLAAVMLWCGAWDSRRETRRPRRRGDRLRKLLVVTR